LIEDVARYKEHPDCEHLVCFIYHPDGRITNARGLENDLSTNDRIKVHAIIRPS
jgi:hypothetical protein